MAAMFDSPAKCELRSVIRFLQAEGKSAAEIHRRMSLVYGENFMSDGVVREWCRKFKAGRTDVHDEGGQGRKSVGSENLVQRINHVIREKRRFTISELALDFPEISRSSLYKIVTERLGYRKLCARWIPKMLTEHHKTQRMASALSFLTRYNNEGEDFLKSIVTGDETWILYDNSETKQQSKQWTHTNSPKPRKAKQTISNRKIMATLFWDQKGVLLVDFMEPGTTITADVYCQTLRRLRRAIQNKRRGLLSSGVVLIHDNVRPHTAVITRQLLTQFQWDIFDHPPYSPDLAPNDYHLFRELKTFKDAVSVHLNALAAPFYEEGIGKLVPRYDNLLGDYVEK